jgi:preprotein translocase subunit YajC
MDFFISTASAQAAPGPAVGAPAAGLLEVLPLLIIGVIFYFIFVRPEQRRKKEHKRMVDTLELGDEVETKGGLLGKVKQIDNNFAQIEVTKGVVVMIKRDSIAGVMPKDTMNSMGTAKSPVSTAKTKSP